MKKSETHQSCCYVCDALRDESNATIEVEASAKQRSTVASGTTYVLNADHTVYPYGKDWCGEDDVRGWSDIIYIDGGDRHTIGLTSSGTVEVAGDNANLQFQVRDWTNIVAISTGQFHTIGIDMYGIIHITGPAGADYCSGDGDSIWQ